MREPLVRTEPRKLPTASKTARTACASQGNMGDDSNQRFTRRQPSPSTDARTAHHPATSASAPSNADALLSVTLPTIAAPKGGGAIRGIGETFRANPVTGSGSLAVPLPL